MNPLHLVLRCNIPHSKTKGLGQLLQQSINVKQTTVCILTTYEQPQHYMYIYLLLEVVQKYFLLLLFLFFPWPNPWMIDTQTHFGPIMSC